MSVGGGVAPRRADVLRVLAAHRDELARDYFVRSLALFGSVGRDDAGPSSDVDVLVDFEPGATLFTMGGLQQHLEALLGRRVDLVSRRAIKRQIRDSVLGEAVPILVTGPDGRLLPVADRGAVARVSERPGRGRIVAERNWKMWIEDVLQAIEEITQFTEGTSFEAFAADRRTVLAVNHSFTIIGEAERHVPPEVKARYPAIPWADMRGMRNVLIHRYPDVDLAVVCTDRLRVDATLRNIEVIGETARYVPDEVRARYPDVPWQRMADMRNLVIHAYPDIVWQWSASTCRHSCPTCATSSTRSPTPADLARADAAHIEL